MFFLDSIEPLVAGRGVAPNIYTHTHEHTYLPRMQASFQRAHVLMSMEKYEDALKELQVVRDNVPKESAVYFLMGKVRFSSFFVGVCRGNEGGIVAIASRD